MDEILIPDELKEFSRSKISWNDPLLIQGESFTVDEILSKMAPLLTQERFAKMNQVIERRTCDVVTVLENTYDLGNVNAVFRSAEAFGFFIVHLVTSPEAKFKRSNRVTRGADKWLDVHLHNSATQCISTLKQKGYQIFATHMEASTQVYDLDFSKPTTIVFGNEKEGVSEKMLELCDGSVVIPMQGFTQSFNISVAASLIFYQAWRDRELKLGQSGNLSFQMQKQILANYYLRQLDSRVLRK